MKARVSEETSIFCLLNQGDKDCKPMRNLKEAVVKIAAQTWCEPLGGLEGRIRYPQLLKSNILSVIQLGKGSG